jgi:hypothetical protein
MPSATPAVFQLQENGAVAAVQASVQVLAPAGELW